MTEREQSTKLTPPPSFRRLRLLVNSSDLPTLAGAGPRSLPICTVAAGVTNRLFMLYAWLIPQLMRLSVVLEMAVVLVLVVVVGTVTWKAGC